MKEFPSETIEIIAEGDTIIFNFPLSIFNSAAERLPDKLKFEAERHSLRNNGCRGGLIGGQIMKIYSVYDEQYKPYGRVVEGMEGAKAQILEALATTPLPEAVGYVAEEACLQQMEAAKEVSLYLYGGMPVQMGRCNGHNTRLNCLEYHRDSEFNLGTEDFILLVAKQHEIENGELDTSKVMAFRVPAGVMVECYGTTLHYAPCHTDPAKGFRVLIALPKGTNTDKPAIEAKTWEDGLMWACNKWLLAHPDTDEAKQGAYVGLPGENIDIAGRL